MAATDDPELRTFLERLAQSLNAASLSVAVIDRTARGPLDSEIVAGLREATQSACELIHAYMLTIEGRLAGADKIEVPLDAGGAAGKGPGDAGKKQA